MTLTPRMLTYRLHTKDDSKEEIASLHDLVWSTTFCDLVTLLLCFFLTMVSFGPIGKAHRQTIENQTESQPDKAKSETGTGLALKGEGVEKRVFMLTRDDVTELANGSVTAALNEVKNIAASGGYEKRRIRITVSPQAPDTPEGEKWLSIIQRLSNLQRQLFDARWQTTLALRIAPLPSDQAPESDEKREEIVGMIEIEDESSPHG